MARFPFPAAPVFYTEWRSKIEIHHGDTEATEEARRPR